MKKTLSVISFFAFVVCALPFSAFGQDVSKHNQEKAVNALQDSSPGVNDISWKDISFWDDSTEKSTSQRLREVEQALDRISAEISKPVQSIRDKKLPSQSPTIYTPPPETTKDIRSKVDPLDIWPEKTKEPAYSPSCEPSEPKKQNSRYTIAPKPSKPKFETNISAMSGYRHDDFSWNIAGDLAGANPNIASELQWKDLQMAEFKIKGNLIYSDRYVLDGSAAFSDIYKGSNQNSSYSGDNRTSESSRETSSSDDGELFDLSGGIGYRFDLGAKRTFLDIDRAWLTVLGGYSYHEQNLNMQNGVNEIPATGAFSGLADTYETEWKGPWLGFELEGIKDRLKGLFRFEYHLVDYYAKADWNLRNDYQHPISFEHDADGYGLVFGIGAGYILNDNWSIDLNADIQSWLAEDGTDTLYKSDGSVVKSKLNEVDWDAYSIMLGATYHFAH